MSIDYRAVITVALVALASAAQGDEIRQGKIIECENENLVACVTAGMRHQAEGAFARAVSFYQTACDGGNSTGCTILGMLHEEEGEATQYRRARQLYLQACDQEDWHACARLGWLLHDGKGGDHNQDEAKRLWQRACDHGEALACHLQTP